MEPKEEIKAKLPIYDLVSQYVELKKAGRNFKGLCPFHNEKTPSFIVSPEKEIAYCFGCHQGGDIFAFFEHVEGVSFPEALRALAEKVGVTIDDKSFSDGKVQKTKREKLLKAHDEAASYFEVNLADEPKVQSYLKKRGLSEETVSEFRLGFSPDSFDQTYKHLLKAGFDKSDLIEAGLSSAKKSDSTEIFDRFRGRLMFPIFDKNGNIIAFGGRALKEDESAKYLNSPETPIYHKSEALYGFSHAKETIRKERNVIIVEGYFDFLMCYQAGYKNTVAVSGTALTQRHLTFLKRYVDSVLFCFDSDSAGLDALYRAAELALPLDLNVKVIDLGEHKDPADAIREDVEFFGKQYAASKEFVDYVLEKEILSLSQEERSKLENLSAFLKKVLPIFEKISSPVNKDIVLRKLAQALGVKVEVIYDEISKFKDNKKVIKKNTDPESKQEKFHFDPEDYLWGYMFLYPKLFKEFVNILSKKEFLINQNEVYKLFLDNYNDSDDFSDLLINDSALDKANLKKFNVLALYLESVHAQDWDEDQVKGELNCLLQMMLKKFKKSEGERIQRALSDAENEKDAKAIKELLQEYYNVLSL